MLIANCYTFGDVVRVVDCPFIEYFYRRHVKNKISQIRESRFLSMLPTQNRFETINLYAFKLIFKNERIFYWNELLWFSLSCEKLEKESSWQAAFPASFHDESVPHFPISDSRLWPSWRQSMNYFIMWYSVVIR